MRNRCYRLWRPILLLLILMPASAVAWNKTALMALLTTTKGSEQRYTETKQLAFLEVSVVSHGLLTFLPPDRLIKQLDPPDSSRYEIIGSSMTISRPDVADQIVSIDAHPLLRIFIDTLRAVLMGDLKLLDQYYAIELMGHRGAWQLQLSPRDSQLAASVDSLMISGSERYIEQMVTQEIGGDQTTLTLHRDSE